MTDTTTQAAALPDRITAYLIGGGLFNPELANHEAVRDLLIDCREALQEACAERDALRADAERYRWLRRPPNNLNMSVYAPGAMPGSGLLRRDTYLDHAIDDARKEGD